MKFNDIRFQKVQLFKSTANSIEIVMTVRTRSTSTNQELLYMDTYSRNNGLYVEHPSKNVYKNVTIKANDICTSTERESYPFTDSFSFKILRNIDPNLDQLDNYRQLIIMKDIFSVYNIFANYFHNLKNIRTTDIIFYYNDSKIWHKFQ